MVAHLTFSYINLVCEEKFQVLGLAPVAVRPKFKNQGIGSGLINAGLIRLLSKELCIIFI
ncbi:MAG: GNAT family N-acetyltransferase [Rivularia sp. ALOHA_DT_140]|nr:GNAT family N-acetyltransferase [Rivularia sp. ALOHA_DT_140]